MELVRGADLQIVPSESYETFGMVAIEALASGTPVVVSRMGGLDEIVDEGVSGAKFEAGNAQQLASIVRRLWSNKNELYAYRANCRKIFEKKYTAEKNYQQLMEIYRQESRRIHRNRVRLINTLLTVNSN